jgi:predicted rRNA methylase YqxC with S4 and FtsJ domains
VQAAAHALAEHGWQVLGEQPSPILGSKGAVETFLHARSGGRPVSLSRSPAS